MNPPSYGPALYTYTHKYMHTHTHTHTHTLRLLRLAGRGNILEQNAVPEFESFFLASDRMARCLGEGPYVWSLTCASHTVHVHDNFHCGIMVDDKGSACFTLYHIQIV